MGYVGAAAANSGSGTSNAPRATMPAGVSSGDIAVMWVSSNTGSESYSSGGNWSGWSQNGSTVYNSTVMATAMFVKTLAGTEAGQSTGPNLGASRRWTCSIVVVNGMSLDQVISDQKTTTGTTTSVPCPAATPSANNALVVAYGGTLGQGNQGTSYTFTSGANYTERTDTCTSQASQLEQGASISTRQLSGGSGSPETPSALTTSQNVGRQNRWTLTFIPSAITVAVGTFAETDALAAVGRRKNRVPGALAETDALAAVGKAKRKAVSAFAETDALASVTRRKTRSVGSFAEVDTLSPLPQAIVVAVGTFTETDALTAVGRRKSRAVGAFAETGVLAALGRRKSRTVGTWAETDALTSVVRRKAKTVGTFAETDALAAVGRRKSRTMGAITESDAIGPVGKAKRKAVGAFAETDACSSVGRRKTITVSIFTESDAFTGVGKAKRKTVGTWAESGSLAAVTRRKSRQIGGFTELDDLTGLPKLIHVGSFAEVDMLGPVGRLKSRTVGVWAEGGSLAGVGRRKTWQVGTLTEVDTLTGVTLVVPVWLFTPPVRTRADRLNTDRYPQPSARAGFRQRVRRAPTPVSVVVIDGVAYEKRHPREADAFVGGRTYTLRGDDPRLPALQAKYGAPELVNT